MVQNKLGEQIQIDTTSIIKDLVDFLLPILSPIEVSVYLFLLRNTYIETGFSELRIGKRTMGEKIKSNRSEKTEFHYLTRVLKSLELKGCIKIGEATIQGMLYTIILPQEVPSVKAKISEMSTMAVEEDYFRDPEKRKILFERDRWTCQYCGEKVNEYNVTLDHYIPVSKEGKDTPDNLKTCCLICNSLKSGRTYEEAAPLILKSLQERRSK
jgi:hypothetical protein